ncbi:MAG: hypothetical protein VKI81_06945 [Synechococcaceae cyanobacterium]|nr:hypothetical protein [Synechococcaceae cyanobacterium]
MSWRRGGRGDGITDDRNDRAPRLGSVWLAWLLAMLFHVELGL